MTNPSAHLIARSNRPGADPRNANNAGGTVADAVYVPTRPGPGLVRTTDLHVPIDSGVCAAFPR